jgi:hypothetical protein
VKPGDYPLCSRLSRVAARKMLEQRQSGIERLEIIIGVSDWDKTLPHATEWTTTNEKGRLCRTVTIPSGMSLADGLRRIGHYPDGLYLYAEKTHPEPMTAGSLLTLRW